ncbi:MAG: copper chaperone PCu(A)C [Nitratireductor sp.]
MFRSDFHPVAAPARALHVPAVGAAALSLIAVVALSVFTLLSPPPAKAHEEGPGRLHHGDLTIINAWVRATPPGAKVAGGYLTVRNDGDQPDRLIGGAAEFAGRVEIHEMTMEGEVMKMAPLADGLEIPAGGAVALKPGGLHVMFMGLRRALKEGETAEATLIFERAGRVELPFAVAPMGAKSHGHGHGEMNHES